MVDSLTKVHNHLILFIPLGILGTRIPPKLVEQ